LLLEFSHHRFGLSQFGNQPHVVGARLHPEAVASLAFGDDEGLEGGDGACLARHSQVIAPGESVGKFSFRTCILSSDVGGYGMAEELIPFNVKLPKPLLKKLRVRAAQEEATMQTLVEALLELGLKKLECLK
jgi:hypothetical protein